MRQQAKTLRRQMRSGATLVVHPSRAGVEKSFALKMSFLIWPLACF
jgi:hypothetical protein